MLHRYGPLLTRANNTCLIGVLCVHVMGSYTSSQPCLIWSVPHSRQLPTRRLASCLSLGILKTFFREDISLWLDGTLKKNLWLGALWFHCGSLRVILDLHELLSLLTSCCTEIRHIVGLHNGLSCKMFKPFRNLCRHKSLLLWYEPYGGTTVSQIDWNLLNEWFRGCHDPKEKKSTLNIKACTRSRDEVNVALIAFY